MGIASSTWHYRHHRRPAVQDPVPQAQRAYPARLEVAEQDQIRRLLARGASRGESVYQCWFDALDAGDPVASISTWYRIARAAGLPRPSRPRRRRRTSAMPEFEATAPNQVWCWDITKLPGTYRGQWLAMYVVIDVFSRAVVAFRVEQTENDDLAKVMFEEAITAQGGVAPTIIHSDGGASMMSSVLAEFYRDLGIIRSRNRPRVSNDNPHIESWFKTAKYRPATPAWFTDLNHARGWARDTVDWYNHQHHHSSLEGHTAAAVHDGTWRQVHQQRQATLDNLATRRPERFHRQPRLRTPYATVRLNREKSPQRLQTA